MIDCQDDARVEVAVEEALASAMRAAVMLAAARLVGPGRTLETVLERVTAVEFMFLDVAKWVLHGKHRPYCKRL